MLFVNYKLVCELGEVIVVMRRVFLLPIVAQHRESSCRWGNTSLHLSLTLTEASAGSPHREFGLAQEKDDTIKWKACSGLGIVNWGLLEMNEGPLE